MNDNIANKKLIASNEYDAMGQLNKKTLAPAFNSGAGLETLDYTYNIRGWLKGINKDYANAVKGNKRWFGMELTYEWDFTHSDPLNGNIGGTT